jgi:hypothetical protein
VGLAAAVWVQVAAGSAYVFPLYSHAVKEALGYDQKALTMLGVGNDVGENVGLVPGVLANRLPPWLILVIGSACAFFGFGTLWLAVTKTVAMPYWVVRPPPLPFSPSLPQRSDSTPECPGGCDFHRRRAQCDENGLIWALVLDVSSLISHFQSVIKNKI